MNRPNIKRHVHKSFLALAISAAAFALPGSAQADKPGTANGSWNDCNVITDVRQSGPNLILTVLITENFTGTFTGSYQGFERDVIYADGTATFHGSGTFTGTVSGRSGTVVMSYAGTAFTPTATANWVVDQGTGDLASLHGRGTFQGNETGPTEGCDDTFAGTYTGQIQFAP
jgi:hypothetical protein